MATKKSTSPKHKTIKAADKLARAPKAKTGPKGGGGTGRKGGKGSGKGGKGSGKGKGY